MFNRKYRQIRQIEWDSSSGQWELKVKYQLQYSYLKITWKNLGPSLYREEDVDNFHIKYINNQQWMKYYE